MLEFSIVARKNCATVDFSGWSKGMSKNEDVGNGGDTWKSMAFAKLTRVGSTAVQYERDSMLALFLPVKSVCGVLRTGTLLFPSCRGNEGKGCFPLPSHK